MTVTEEENERWVIACLALIAVAAIAGALVLAASTAKSGVGIDTAVMVGFLGVATQCASSLGTRRTRTDRKVPE